MTKIPKSTIFFSIALMLVSLIAISLAYTLYTQDNASSLTPTEIVATDQNSTGVSSSTSSFPLSSLSSSSEQSSVSSSSESSESSISSNSSQSSESSLESSEKTAFPVDFILPVKL